MRQVSDWIIQRLTNWIADIAIPRDTLLAWIKKREREREVQTLPTYFSPMHTWPVAV